MNLRAAAAVVLGLALAASSGAGAQTAASVVDDPEATILSDLVVVAPTAGPAWWRVSKGNSVVWIMGLPDSPAPKGLKWDRKALGRRLEGARAVMGPPTIRLMVPPPAQAKAGGVSASSDNVELKLGPAFAQRFVSARTRLRQPARRYAGWTSAGALLMLYDDYRKSARLVGPSEIMRWTKAMGRTRKVTVVTQTVIDAGTLRHGDTAPDNPGAAACYDALLAATEVSVERYRLAAAGWARGDLGAATSAPRDPRGVCENRLFNAGAGSRAIELQTAAIRGALETPGKTVVLASVRSLIANEGIIVHLKRAGYDVMSPSETGHID